MKSTITLVAAAICALTLTACGGGGGDSSSTATDTSQSGSTDTANSNNSTAGSGGNGTAGSGNSNPADNGNTGAGSTVALRYEALSSPSDVDSVLQLFNQESGKGYRYLSGMRHFDAQMYYYVSTVEGPDDGKSIFINDGVKASYAYEFLPEPSSEADMIKQLNEEGIKGYRYEGFNIFQKPQLRPDEYVLYSKAVGSSNTYTYAPGTDTTGNNVNDILAQMNVWGASGYVLYGLTFGFNFYEKNNTSNARYVYEVGPMVRTEKDMLAQLNSEGARGYYPRTHAVCSSSGCQYVVYVKDQTQSATFTWLSEPAPTDNAQFTALLNRLGAQGYAYFSSESPEVDGVVQYDSILLFSKASNCRGDMCRR